MQDSKINSTLKIGVFMRLIEGEKNFVCPPLRTAQVFSGIAGIVSGEQGDAEEAGTMPSLTAHSRDTSELQDMYRRTLAAYWSAQPGELKADECIEDIFAGGDGWGDREKPYSHSHSHSQYDHSHSHDYDRGNLQSQPSIRFHKSHNGSTSASASTSDSDGRGSLREHSHGHHLHMHMHTRMPSLRKSHETLRPGDASRRSRSGSRSRSRSGSFQNMGGMSAMGIRRMGSQGSVMGTLGSVRGRGSLEQEAKSMAKAAERENRRPCYEVDEFEAREDLKSWVVPGPVESGNGRVEGGQ